MKNIVLFGMIIFGAVMHVNSSVQQFMTPAGIKGHPFKAQYEDITTSTTPDGKSSEQRRTGEIYRDSEGRTRQDTHMNINAALEIHLAVIYDPLSRTIYTLNIRSKTLNKSQLPTLEERGAGKDTTMQSGIDNQVENIGEREEILGDKVIEGVMCRGYRVKLKDSVSEVWYSYELKQVMEKRNKGERGEQVFRLFDIHLIEPDADYFTIPADYKLLENDKKNKQ